MGLKLRRRIRDLFCLQVPDGEWLTSKQVAQRLGLFWPSGTPRYDTVYPVLQSMVQDQWLERKGSRNDPPVVYRVCSEDVEDDLLW